MDLLVSILDDRIFQFIVAICSIFSVIISILALIPSTRSKIFYKKNIKQRIDGTNNLQAGENISKDGETVKNGGNRHKSISISQAIKGNGQ
jgi:hypothetical protein